MVMGKQEKELQDLKETAHYIKAKSDIVWMLGIGFVCRGKLFKKTY